MWQISVFLLGISLCIFLGVMAHDPRTLWSGVSFSWMLICAAVAMFFLLAEYADWLTGHGIAAGILVALLILAVLCILAFPVALIAVFFIEGIKVIRHEGPKRSNLLSMLFAILLYLYLMVWPVIGNPGRNSWSRTLYIAISLAAAYLLLLMTMYSFSAVLNLIHFKKSRRADYIIVLGSGIIGTKVTPLLAARIEKGMELLRRNPDATLILSGGQGPGEDIPESEAMAAYALEKGVDAQKILTEKKSVSTRENLVFSRELMDKSAPRIVIATTSYHVFRALVLARRQGIRCVGFGAKTKWYFTLNAFLREFVGYLRLTWKKHALVLGIITGLLLVGQLGACIARTL